MRAWLTLLLSLSLFSNAAAEEGGASVIADPSLAYGDWPERVSLAMPPAARGTAPEVALVAAHRVTQSDVGSGWQLAVGSVIRRRSATGGAPEHTSTMASSQFLADGAELVKVIGVGTDHYQPETYDGSRFDYDATTNVWTRRRDGWTWTYGGVSNTSRAIALPPSLPLCSAPCNTEAWFLASTVDPFNNRIDYTYENVAMPAELSTVFGSTPSRDYQVKTITYGAGTAVITFTYATRPDVTVDFSGGFPIVHHRRLTRVESTAGGQFYSKYVLQYEDESGNHSLLGSLTDCDDDSVSAPASPTRRSLLRKVFRNSPNNSVKHLVRCNRYHHQTIAWFGSTDYSTEITSPFATLEPVVDTWTPVAVEVNGDGRTDLILLAYHDGGQTEHKVYISTPTSATKFTGSTGSGDPRVYASDWEGELNGTLGSGVFGNKLGRAIVDINGDIVSEVLAESGDDVVIRQARTNGGANGVAAVTFSDLSNDLAACDLRFGEFADVDGDSRSDLVVRAHGSDNGCPDEDESYWIKNLGTGPWFDSEDRRDLHLPIELGTAVGWSTALAACPNGVVPPTDYNPDWTDEGYLADQTRFADFNNDGVMDAAVAVYACWTTAADRWRPVLASAYSRIAYGNGRGFFFDSGLSAGPPVLLDPLDFGASTTDDNRIVTGMLSAIDFDRDGRSELLQSTAEAADRMGYGFATCASALPSSGGYGVAANALLPTLITVQNSAWDCNELARTTAWGDFDGDGFLDLIGVHGQSDWWWAGVSYSSRTNSENRLLATDNEHGGRTTLTWGFSALAPNTNPELPNNVEVLQSVSGPSGTRSLSYHDGAMRGDRLMPFGEVSVTNDRGGIEVYSFVINSWGGAKPQYLGVRYRENGTLEHVTVLFHGEYIPGVGFFADVSPPYFNPLVRRCEFDVGFRLVDIDALEDRCRDLAWLAPAVPQTGWSSEGSIQVNDQNWDLLVGRRRQPTTAAERTAMPKLYRARGGRDASPISSRMVAATHALTLSTIVDHVSVVTSNDYYRWPLPFALAGKLPDVEASEAGYQYPGFLMISDPDGYAWDYGFDHPLHKLVTRYEHRDLSTLDDDRHVRYESDRPGAPAVGVLGDWWRVYRETTSDRTGTRLTQLDRSTWVGFDTPTVVKTCGRTTPADCATDKYEYNSNGTLKKHWFPDQTTESWTRQTGCGEPLTYTDATNQVTTYTRNTGGDTRCLTKSIKRNGATWTYTHDDLLRPKTLVVAPGAGVSDIASVSKTYYYDDALTYQATVDAREDWAYAEPRRAERRSDGQLELVYTDGLGRETKRVRCADTGTNTTGGDIGLVACPNAKRVVAWNLYGTDGNLKITTASHDVGETPTVTGYGHDGQSRRLVVMEPVHVPGVRDWRVDTLSYGDGYEQRVEPTATGTVVTRRDHTTLSEALIVASTARGSLKRGVMGEIKSITSTDGSITKRLYDGKWQLQSEIRVDAAGLPVRESVILPDGTSALRPFEHTITARDARGRVTEEVTPDGTVLGYAYDGLDRVLRREVNGVVVRSYNYTAATVGLKGSVRVVDELGGSTATSQIDGLGRVWNQTAPRVANASVYDSKGQLASVTNIDNLATSFYYDIQGDLTSVVDARTGTTTYDRDGASRIVSRTDADGAVETFSYTYSGLPYEHRRGPYLVAQQTYDPRGLVTSAIEDGVATAMTYDTLGRLTKRREGVTGNQELRVTTLFYDTGDRVIETRRTPVAGLQTATSYTHYDAWGRAYEEIDARGNTTSRAFDAAGRVRRTRDQEGVVLDTIYDELGRITDRQLPGAGWEHTRYAGRQVLAGEPNLWRVDTYDDEDAARGVKTQRYMDGSGNVLAELRRDGSQVRWTRPTGRVTREELYAAGGALFNATDLTYDPITGALESTTRGPYAVSYDYSPAGRLTRTITPDDTHERHYEHGMLARTVEAGITHRYGRNQLNGWVVTEQVQVGSGAIRYAEIGRDDLGRIGRVQWTDGTGPATTQTFSLFDYYDNAWLATNQWGVNGAFTVVEASTFDELGRPLTKATSGAGLPGRTISWGWFDNGVLASVTTPAPHTITYDYGPTFDHRLDAVQLDGTTVASVTARDLRGAITTLSLPNAGQVRTTSYDEVGRPEARTTGPALPAVDFAWTATYNADGTLETESVDDVTGANGWVNEYTYDDAGRLIVEVAGKTDTTLTYTLDAAGNRTSTEIAPPAPAVPTITAAQYAGPKLLQVGATALGYNAWNEVATDHHGNNYGRSADGAVTLIARGAAATALARNARGVPVAALEPGLVTRRTTYGLSAAGLPVEVDEGDGTVLTYLNVEGQHIGTAVNGVLAPVESDPRSSPLRIGTTALGAATAFGVGTSAPAGSDERFLFAMLERVPTASEIMLARHRTYDPTIGRFLEPDPIGTAGGLELYQYGHGDPVNFVDPLGHAEIGTVCSTGTITLGVQKIEPMTAQTMDSGVQPSMFDEIDAARALRAIAAASPMAGFSIDLGDTNYPPDFPGPKGPLCVVNCAVIIVGGSDKEPSKPKGSPADTSATPDTKPAPAPAAEPAAPVEPVVETPTPKGNNPLEKLGEAVKDFVDKLFGSSGGDGEQGQTGAERIRNKASEIVRTIHEKAPGTLGREALGREVLDRGAGWARGLADAPSKFAEGARQLGTQFKNDPVGTTVSVGVDMITGTARDFVEGAGQWGSGVSRAPGAAYRMWTAGSDAEASDAAGDFLDAAGDMAAGTYKVSGPVLVVTGVGVGVSSGSRVLTGIGKAVGPRTYRGGAHRFTKKPVNDGLDSHHTPAKASSPLDPDDGPAIQMEPHEHRMTSSHGSQPGSAQYRQDIKNLIDAGEWRKAMAREIRDVRNVTRQSRGTARTYTDAMFEMLDYAKDQGLLDKP